LTRTTYSSTVATEKKLRRTAPICGPAWSPGQPAPTSQIQGAKPSRLLFLLRRNLMAMI